MEPITITALFIFYIISTAAILLRLRYVTKKKKLVLCEKFSDHAFFNKMDDLTTNVIPRISIPDKRKEYLVKAFLLLQLNTLKRHLDVCMSKGEAFCEVKQVVDILDEVFEDSYVIAAQKGMPEVFLTRYKLRFKDSKEDVIKWSEISLCFKPFY